MRLTSSLFELKRYFCDIEKNMDLVNFDVYVNEDLTITIQTDRKSAESFYRLVFYWKIFYKNIYIYIEKKILYIFVF